MHAMTLIRVGLGLLAATLFYAALVMTAAMRRRKAEKGGETK